MGSHGTHMFVLKPVSYPLGLSALRAELNPKLEGSGAVTKKDLSNQAHLLLCSPKTSPGAWDAQTTAVTFWFYVLNQPARSLHTHRALPIVPTVALVTVIIARSHKVETGL